LTYDASDEYILNMPRGNLLSLLGRRVLSHPRAAFSPGRKQPEEAVMSDTSGNRVFNLSFSAGELAILNEALAYAIVEHQTFITNHGASMPGVAALFSARAEAFEQLRKRVLEVL
jgi:hypothetical protein